MCTEVAIGHIGLHFTGTVLILLLGIKCVYIDFNCIGIATGRTNLPYCYCLIILTERICIFIDCTCIEIATEHIS